MKKLNKLRLFYWLELYYQKMIDDDTRKWRMILKKIEIAQKSSRLIEL